MAALTYGAKVNLPVESPPVDVQPRLFRCWRCRAPLGLVFLGPDSRVERRCHRCRAESAQHGMRDAVPAERDTLPASNAIHCVGCSWPLGKALLAPGSFFQPRCRSCRKTTAVVGPWPRQESG